MGLIVQRQSHYGALIDALFEMAKQNPKAGMNRPGRLLGKHCTARYERSRAKRAARNKARYIPLTKSWVRPAAGYSQLSPKIDGVRYRCQQGEMVPR